MRLFILYFFVAIIVIAMLRNPAAATGIIVGLGDAGSKFSGTLVGGTSGAKGTVTTSGGSKLTYG